MRIFNTIMNVVFAIILAIILVDLYVFKTEGKRFTFCDGVIIHSMMVAGTTTPMICYGEETEFTNYLKEYDKRRTEATQ